MLAPLLPNVSQKDSLKSCFQNLLCHGSPSNLIPRSPSNSTSNSSNPVPALTSIWAQTPASARPAPPRLPTTCHSHGPPQDVRVGRPVPATALPRASCASQGVTSRLSISALSSGKWGRAPASRGRKRCRCGPAGSSSSRIPLTTHHLPCPQEVSPRLAGLPPGLSIPHPSVSMGTTLRERLWLVKGRAWLS